jgi:hypothetical protein
LEKKKKEQTHSKAYEETRVFRNREKKRIENRKKERERERERERKK